MVPTVTLERFKKRTKMASGTWDVNQGQGWGTKGVELRTKEGDGLAPERKMTRKNDGNDPATIGMVRPSFIKSDKE